MNVRRFIRWMEIEPPAVSVMPIRHTSTPDWSRAEPGALDVRFGSKADIGQGSTDVRFTPKSEHYRSANKCPLCAKSGHSAVRRKRRYSITSSASNCVE
jgi:hypothetical protein